MFQLDQSDLDFGIYRIMNTKSKEINEFLDNDLLSSVATAFSSNTNHSIQSELDEAIQQAQALGVDADTIPKVKELKEKLASSTTSSSLENEVFSHLSTFFKRYYKDGDFVSLRRYKKDTYAIPYEGEEVKLHWANSDQYYIKSGEYFRDYTFKDKGMLVGDVEKTIHLKLSDAETEQNNNKATSDKERRFVLLESNPCKVIKDELYINFEYKAVSKLKQDKLNEDAVRKVLACIDDHDFKKALNIPAPTDKNKKRTLFEKHLKSYTSRNSFDY
ncbi:MAG: adenine-specific DNA-methyltransferase, partial [bacterium]